MAINALHSKYRQKSFLWGEKALKFRDITNRPGCCQAKKINERGWCRTCGHQIADPEPKDTGIVSLLRMARAQVAEIKLRWTPRKEETRQLSLTLDEQDRAEVIDWGESDGEQEHRPLWRR